MNGVTDPWQRLAAAAQAEPGQRLPAPDTAWAAAVARQSLAGAALGQPTWVAQTRARVQRPSVVVPTAILIIAIAVWVVPQFGSRHRAEVRYERWAGATLRQLRTWLPMECEQTGQIGLILRDTVQDLKQGSTVVTNVYRLLESTEARIAALLTPEQRAQFETEQGRLRERWFNLAKPPKN